MHKIIHRQGRARFPMELQKLQHFMAVYTSKNFHRASEDCDITQQAISRSISKLEDLLGVRLFDRGSFGAEPTAFGHSLARRVKTILAESHLAVTELNVLRGSSEGHVRIGCGWTFMPRITPDVIQEFKSKYPKVGISVRVGSSEELQPDLVSGDLDMLMSAPYEDFLIDSAVESLVLFEEIDSVIMRSEHPLASKSEISPDDLAKSTWIVALSIKQRWESLSNFVAASGIAQSLNVVDSDSILLAKSLLARGDYLCFMPDELILDELQSKKFIKCTVPGLPLKRIGQCFTRKNSPLPSFAESLKVIFLDVCGKYYSSTTLTK